jgi:hypothetical protein
MQKNQRWRELCAQAAVEQDPKKLLELVAEISRLFDEEHNKTRVDAIEDQPDATDSKDE